MTKFVAVLGNDLGEPQAKLAEGALRAAAGRARKGIRIVREGEGGAPAERAAEETLFVVRRSPGAGSGEVAVPVSEVVQETESVLARLSGSSVDVPNAVAPPGAPPRDPNPAVRTVRVAAVTSCPTGIAHTFMAAAALKDGATALGWIARVETRGSVGAKDTLTDAEIAGADVVLVAADTHVDLDRFAGRKLFQASTKDAIHDPEALLRKALAEARTHVATAAPGTAAPAREKAGAYKHLMTGVSHMLPLVVAGGLLIALAFAVGGIHAGDAEGTLGWALMQIGGKAAFQLYVPVLAGFIAFSIADRPGLAPGLVGGLLSSQLGAGFLGGIAAGFLAGYATRFLSDRLPLPAALQSLKPVLILPLLSTLVVGLAMVYVVGTPVKIALEALTGWLAGLQSSSALALGLLLGGMMAFDLGGPVNKAAYAFSVGLLASGIQGPMAATMAAGMTPPLGIALACLLFPSRFTAKERGESKAMAVLGLSFVSEGAIPFAATDPLRIIPALVAGSATAGAISMATGTHLVVPHGGIFVLAIPHAVSSLLPYAVAIVAGTLVTAVAIRLLKRPPVVAAKP